MPDETQLLFVPSPHGYELVERVSRELSVGSELELGGRRLVVTKIGPSPFPADERRCAFLQVAP